LSTENLEKLSNEFQKLRQKGDQKENILSGIMGKFFEKLLDVKKKDEIKDEL
jgi:hypothetical protein